MIPASAVIWSFATGFLVTVVAAVFPALRAGRIPPVAAMQDVAIDRSATSRRRPVIGLIVMLLGAALMALGLTGGGQLAALGLGVVVVFIGVAVLGPAIARSISGALGAPIARLAGITGRLARENAMRNPKRTSATAAALMIGVALVGLITVFGASARASIDNKLDQSMKADYVVNSGGFGQGSIPVAAEKQLAAVPNVVSVSGIRIGQAKVKGSVEQIIGADPQAHRLALRSAAGTGQARRPRSERNRGARRRGRRQPLEARVKATLLFPSTGKHEFTVQAIYAQTGFTDYVITIGAYKANYPDQFDFQIYIKTKGGATPANTAALKQVVNQYPGPKLMDRAQYKAEQAGKINQFLNLVYVLLFFAIVIALFGIANTLGLSIIERRHELGLLRAVGMSRRQLRASVRWESVIVALLGTFLGLVLGVVFAWALVSALTSEGIDTFSLAPVQLVVIVVLAALFGVLAAAAPARRAAKLDVLRSIQS